MTATVAAATAVEASTTTMEAAATVETPTGTVEGASTVKPANFTTSSEPAAAIEAVAAVPTPSGASPVSRATPEAAVKPRAGADENTTGEPARAVITVGRARVRVIRVVTVGANGSWPDVPGPDSHAHDNALRVGVWRYCQTKSEQSENHEVLGISHIWAPSEPVKPFRNSLYSDGLFCHCPSSST